MAKTVFITGGAKGIGRAAVEKFASCGWNVSFMDIDADAGKAVTAESEYGDRILFCAGSTLRRDDIRRAVDNTIARFGSLDSVIVNAGIHRSNTLLDISDEELHLLIDTNIYGSIDTLRETVPHIAAAGGGTVVINASDQWFMGKAHSFGYGLTKGALGQITRSLAIDLAPMGIRVNAVCPSTIRTPLVDGVFERASAKSGTAVEELWKEENALFLRGSCGRPGEVAEVMYFLASDASSFCTGAHYAVDGGLTAM